MITIRVCNFRSIFHCGHFLMRKHKASAVTPGWTKMLELSNVVCRLQYFAPGALWYAISKRFDSHASACTFLDIVCFKMILFSGIPSVLQGGPNIVMRTPSPVRFHLGLEYGTIEVHFTSLSAGMDFTNIWCLFRICAYQRKNKGSGDQIKSLYIDITRGIKAFTT